MSDIADLTASMIIRPGKAPVWYFIPRGDCEDSFARSRATSKHGLGMEVTLRERCRPKECCGVVFLSLPNGGIKCPDCWRINWFFERDSAEALVFEYDVWQKRFFARNQESIWNRCLR